MATGSHTVEEIAEIQSQATGKTIRYADVPAAARRSGMEGAGVANKSFSSARPPGRLKT
jgi:hypothetical protein